MRQSPFSVCTTETPGLDHGSQGSRARGFTIIELAIVLAIVGTLAGMASVGYARVADRARVAQAIGDIKAIGLDITSYRMENGSYPNSLAEAGIVGTKDPWGNTYRYLALEGQKNQGAARKDKNLVPINADFDLYSVGKDGSTVAALTATASHDDIVRANSGGFVGLATSY